VVHLDGDRQALRRQTLAEALQGILRIVATAA